MEQTTVDRKNKTKYWFRLFSRSATKQKSGHPTVILLPEIQEAILERICDSNTLIKCRQVCSHWKQFIDTLLEQRRLSQWTVWDLELNSYPKLLHPPVWVLSKTEVTNRCAYSSHICRPSALKTRKGVCQPFPDKSAALINCYHWHENKKFINDCPTPISNKKFMEPFTEFFIKSGSSLTSLVLHYVFLTHRDFSIVINESQNLKALTLYDFWLVDYETNVEIKAPPNLTHLQVFETFVGLDSLMDSLCGQLVSLKLAQNSVNEIRSRPRKFLKLKQLYIYKDTEINLRSLSSIPEAFPVLEYFSATGMDRLEREKMESFTHSVSSIADSLVYFRSTSHILSTVCQEFGLVFPKIIFLVVVCNSEEPELNKEDVLEWFPRVESVTSVVETKWRVHDFENGQKCFVCDKLKLSS